MIKIISALLFFNLIFQTPLLANTKEIELLQEGVRLFLLDMPMHPEEEILQIFYLIIATHKEILTKMALINLS